MVPKARKVIIFYYLALSAFTVLFMGINSLAQDYSTAFTFSTLCGSPPVGYSDGVGNNAQFVGPQGIAMDPAGNLYVSDQQENTIRRIDPGGVVRTIAGFPGQSQYADGLSINTRFSSPYLMTADQSGNIYVADTGNAVIRKISQSESGYAVSTIAGSAGLYQVMDGTNSSARFQNLYGITIDGSGTLYVTDNDTVRQVRPAGTNWIVTTIAGVPGHTGAADGTNQNALFYQPVGIAADVPGNLYICDYNNNTIRKISRSGTNWMVSTIAGSATAPIVLGGRDGLGTNALFYGPSGITVDSATNLYVTDSQNNLIRKISLVGNSFFTLTVAGSQFGNGFYDGTGTNANFDDPQGILTDNTNLYVADFLNSVIRKISSAGEVTTIAGSGPLNSTGSADGTGSSARFNGPASVAMDGSGNLYVADGGNSLIRKITSSGVVNVFAGALPIGQNTGFGNSGTNDGVGQNAKFYYPDGITIDAVGNLYVADAFNYTIRKVTPAGLVTTIAGAPQVQGHADGTNNKALFFYPRAICLDQNNNLYVTDSGTIRQISPSGNNWITKTITGTPNVYGSADGTNASIKFDSQGGITVDKNNNLVVADATAIRVISHSGTNWISSTIAGQLGYGGFDDGPADTATFTSLTGLAIDANGSIFVCDYDSVRRVDFINNAWVVSTVAGYYFYAGSQDGTGKDVRFNGPNGIAIDAKDDIFIADSGNNTIRKGVFDQYQPAVLAGSPSTPMNASLCATILPPAAHGQWHLPWELAWHNSGDVIYNLNPGNYTVEFRNIPGWIAYPSTLNLTLTNGSATYVTNQYFPTLAASTNNGAGTLVVNLGVNPPPGAGWGFVGDNNPTLSSGFATNLPAGNYLIEFAQVNGRAKPGTLSVPINTNSPTYVNVSYPNANPAPANVSLPFICPTPGSTPFCYAGQLQSDVGYGSGGAVDTNVVLTAAHLVFNDQDLAYVDNAFWFWQREAGSVEPLPQAARGWYVLSGYAAQRTNDLNSGYYPDQSTPPSRNDDVAALYFDAPVAGGGSGGFLPSDSVPNTWLSGSDLKMLSGYPVDGSIFGTNVSVGQMYQTTPQPYALTMDSSSVPGQQEVYQASWFFSYPGNSGGSLYVQLNGNYYPAAVYLGTLYSGSTPVASLVRAIDSTVVNLITNAQALGNSGTNSSGGGVTVLSSSLALGSGGFMQWQIGPPSAVAAGAAWQLLGDSMFSTATNYTEIVNSTNLQTVHFRPVPGWISPLDQKVSVPLGVLTTYGINYTVSNPMLSYKSGSGIGFSGTTGTLYRIEARTNLVKGNWLPMTTNTLTNASFNLVLPTSILTNRSGFYRAVWLQQ